MRPVLALLIFYFLVLFSADAQITLNATPTRVIGQDSLAITNANPNLVEGREFLNPQGIALDMSVNPPALYVADTANNRVLGFRSAIAFANGQKADLVLGQPDLITTIAAGPVRSSHTTGTAVPTGVAVDASGNVYVLDNGNNRIMRFPKPFTQTSVQLPDLVIGQPGYSTNMANQGGISAATLFLSNASTTFQAFITFDGSGNLWVADAGNNRVLRFNANVLGSQAASGPSADLVLGQYDFFSNGYSPSGNPATSLTAFVSPAGIAFDSAGRLFVSESQGSTRGRVLVWNPPFSSGQTASRLLGVDLDTPGPSFISEFQFQSAPGGVFNVGNQIGVADTYNNRILIFAPADQWTSNNLYQAAVQVIGQNGFNSGSINQGQPGAGPSTLNHPVAAVFSGTELFIVDSLNHRVVVRPQTGNTFGPATRVLGQDALNLNGPNLIEGREFSFSGSNAGDAGIAVDLTSNPPHLYVADTYNNRILGYNDLRNLQAGAKADIVIGQPDFQHSWTNYPSNDANKLTSSGLSGPTGLYVDPAGNLYVADTGNSRVLRFPTPFASYQPGVPEPADLVLGQPNFSTKITDPTPRTMSAPYGLAQASEHGLLVSDVNHNRVLFFPGTSKTFTSGEPATLVFGQKDFNSAGPGSGLDQMSSPHHIATDVDDHLYVADTNNARVTIFDHAPTASPDPQAAIVLGGLSTPRGLHVSHVTGDIWVADNSANRAFRFPSFNTLVAIPNYAPNATLSESAPLALTEDAWGNIFIADDANRVIIHYPGLSSLNAANYLYSNQLAPGMIGALYSTGNFHQFGTTTDQAKAIPLPRTLNGIQVLYNGSPVPLFFAGMDQINFQVPIGAPQSGTADIQVIEVATGRLLGDTTMTMSSTVPGIFTQAANGSGAAIAANKDGTLNTQTNPAIAGDFITLYGTGQGYVDGAPPDGDVSHTALPSSRPPTVIVGTEAVTGPDVQYAGIAPGQVGVWQVNVRIPKDQITLPNNPTQVIVVQNSIPSGGGGLGRSVIIYVKQP